MLDALTVPIVYCMYCRHSGSGSADRSHDLTSLGTRADGQFWLARIPSKTGRWA